MANEQNNQNTRVSYDVGSLVGKEPVDIDKYNFIDTKIESVEIHNYGKAGEEERLRLVVKTQKVDEQNNNMRGVEFITLFRDKDSPQIDSQIPNIAYSQSPNSTAQKMLTWFKVNNFKELEGMDCKTQVRLKDNGNKSLGIYYG